MHLGPAGDALVREREGYKEALPDGRCRAYRCPAGVWTIGWGCTEGVYPGLIWTREQAEAGYRREMQKFEDAVTRLVTVPLNQNQFDALVSFAYNCGEGALAHSNILRRLNAGDYEGAAGSFAAWNKARVGGQLVELRGLTIRRAREAALFRTPVDAADEPPMAQKVEPPPAADEHAEAHKELSDDSWVYWLNKLNIKSITAGAGATMLFVKEHALEIGAGAVLMVLLFELAQFAMRKRRMAA